MDSGTIRFDLRGLGAELKDRLVAVPIYQRSYAWTDQKISEYWEDLHAAFTDKDPEYFMGTIVLSKQESSDRYSVIDGQQRLATTSILIAAIRDEYYERNDSKRGGIVQKEYLSTSDLESAEEISRLHLNSEDSHFYEERIVNSKQKTRTH